MLKTLKKFKQDENAAVSLDWVVITAAVIAVAVALMALFRPVLADRTNAIAPLAAQATWETSF